MWLAFRGSCRAHTRISRDFLALTVRQTRRIMVSDSDLKDTLEKQATEAEETVSLLKSQLVLLQRAAEKKVKSSSPQDEAAALKKKNDELREEVERLKAELENWEVKNGLVQVPLPRSTPLVKPAAFAPVVCPPVGQGQAPAAPKSEKKEKKVKEKKVDKAGDKKNTSSAKAVDVSRLDFRVGKILTAKRHPDADTLFVEEIDVGEESPRTVCSGLYGSVTLEDLQGRMAVIMCNLKPVKMRGIVSQAMVMCACGDNNTYEPLDPPPGSVPGDRVTFENYPGVPDEQLNPKRKVWENVQPDLMTDANCVANYKGDPFIVAGKGPCKAQTLSNVKVK